MKEKPLGYDVNHKILMVESCDLHLNFKQKYLASVGISLTDGSSSSGLLLSTSGERQVPGLEYLKVILELAKGR